MRKRSKSRSRSENQLIAILHADVSEVAAAICTYLQVVDQIVWGADKIPRGDYIFPFVAVF